MKNKIIIAAITGILGLTLYVNLFMSSSNNQNPFSSIDLQADLDPLSTSEIRETIDNAVSWFKAQQEFNGHFHYEYMPFLNRYLAADNIVRQTGALYELGEVLRRDKENKYELKRTLEKAISYFEESTVDASYKDIDFKCIVKNEEKCSLGAVGLALIGTLDLVQVYPELEFKYIELIEGYKNYFIAMKKPGAGFINNYNLVGNVSDDESPFSNGEAWLSLVRYNEFNPTDEVSKIIEDSFDFYQVEYSGEGMDANFYLWGMVALKDLYKADPRQEYVDFVKPYTQWRIDSQQKNRGSSHNRCAYIEGVVSAYSILEDHLTSEEKKKHLEEIDFWLSQSKTLQVERKDLLELKYSNGSLKILGLEMEEKAIGGFLTDFNEPLQRIDFTQHCLSSYLQKLVDIDGKTL